MYKRSYCRLQKVYMNTSGSIYVNPGDHSSDYEMSAILRPYYMLSLLYHKLYMRNFSKRRGDMTCSSLHDLALSNLLESLGVPTKQYCNRLWRVNHQKRQEFRVIKTERVYNILFSILNAILLSL